MAVVAAAYVVNAAFNHTAWGLALKAYGDAYVLGFFLPFGVVLPAIYLGRVTVADHAAPRWLGVGLGARDAVAVVLALVVGGLLASGALRSRPGSLDGPEAHRLFALLLVASIAETLVFLGVLGNAVQLATRGVLIWRARALAVVVSSLAFGFFHCTYPSPWNTLPQAFGLALVWVPVSLVFVITRSLVGAVLLNNLLAMVGFVRNGLSLPGTTAEGWGHAALACLVFVVVVRVVLRSRHRPSPPS